MILAVLKILSKLVSDVKLKWGKVFKRGDVNSVTPPEVTLPKDVKPNSWREVVFPKHPLKVVTLGVFIVPTLLIGLQVEKKF